jgi:hypothetical protein
MPLGNDMLADKYKIASVFYDAIFFIYCNHIHKTKKANKAKKGKKATKNGEQQQQQQQQQQ